MKVRRERISEVPLIEFKPSKETLIANRASLDHNQKIKTYNISESKGIRNLVLLSPLEQKSTLT